MDAIILVNKEKGMTSFDVVSRCRKIFHEKRIGHTGTLDPNATGLLIVLVGKYTKFLPYCVKDNKHYQARFSFGIQTTTEDVWGEVVKEKKPGFHDFKQLQRCALEMLGDSIQVPPMYSAIKVNGRKLYEYAREGIEVERPKRNIHVSKFEVKQLEENLFSLDTIVTSGTYVRTLIQDYASKLEELATMTQLERVAIESISITEASTLEQIEAGNYRPLEPRRVFDPSYEMIEFEDEMLVRCGKVLELDTQSNHVILVKGDMILAAYQKEADGLFHAQRGLF